MLIDGKDSDLGALRFGKDSNVTLVRLPSGRSLRYPDLRPSAENRVIKHLDREWGTRRVYAERIVARLRGDGSALRRQTLRKRGPGHCPRPSG